VRGNQSPFINKELSKAIMDRTRLRNKFLKDYTEVNRKKYCKQRNLCGSLLRKSKRDYYGNLNEKLVTDNKTFWRTVKPFLSDKIQMKEKITLIEHETILSEDKDIAETLNCFFSNIVRSLGIPRYIQCAPEPFSKKRHRIRNCTTIQKSSQYHSHKKHQKD
jgi:hypothetical protein